MNPSLVLAGCGAVVGLGAAVAVRAFTVPVPALGDALDRLAGRNAVLPASSAESSTRCAGRVGQWVVRRLAGGRVTLPARDLDITGMSPERYLLRKAALAVAGVLFAPLLALILSLGGIAPAVVVPAAGSVLLGIGGWFLPNVILRDEAGKARDELRRALCSYLDLVSLRRDASEGPTQALELAAAVGRGWEFQRIRAALLEARITSTQPWDGLRSLGEQIAVRELVDIADIAATAAVDGASIVATLRARAASLRTQLLTEDEAAANASSERMSAPVAMLSITFLLLFLYPSVIRILG